MARRSADLTEEELEGVLLSTLKPVRPVQPNPEFVRRLKHRLTTEPVIIVERRTEAAVFVMIAAALFSGAFLVWLILSLRAFFQRGSGQAGGTADR